MCFCTPCSRKPRLHRLDRANFAFDYNAGLKYLSVGISIFFYEQAAVLNGSSVRQFQVLVALKPEVMCPHPGSVRRDHIRDLALEHDGHRIGRESDRADVRRVCELCSVANKLPCLPEL